MNSESFTYNNRNLLTRHTVPGILDTEYQYKAASNDGRVWKQKNWATGEVVEYTYDVLKRLTLAATEGTEWGQSYEYDGFGNLKSQVKTKGTLPFSDLNLSVNSGNNRINSYNYDANGNVIWDGLSFYYYDVENRIAQSPGGQQYGYDASGRRVWDGEAYTFWSPGGRRIGTYKPTTVWSSRDLKWLMILEHQSSNVYFAGRLVAARGRGLELILAL